jgi:hypothetical protein
MPHIIPPPPPPKAADLLSWFAEALEVLAEDAVLLGVAIGGVVVLVFAVWWCVCWRGCFGLCGRDESVEHGLDADERALQHHLEQGDIELTGVDSSEAAFRSHSSAQNKPARRSAVKYLLATLRKKFGRNSKHAGDSKGVYQRTSSSRAGTAHDIDEEESKDFPDMADEFSGVATTNDFAGRSEAELLNALKEEGVLLPAHSSGASELTEDDLAALEMLSAAPAAAPRAPSARDPRMRRM